MLCNVCDSPMGEPIYNSGTRQSLTSMFSARDGEASVWFCPSCGHLRGTALAGTEAFYDVEYRISLDHEDEDQVYEVHGEEILYRTEHQARTLLDKLKLPQGAMLLDYGCAKASTPRYVMRQRPDLQVHLFDVSEMYVAHWDRLVAPERRASYQTWRGRFDVITSFFALEHIPAPQATVLHVASLLKEDGVFYGIVPDTFGNVADFLVADHVNHFTEPSLHALLSACGFRQIEIDAQVHRGALVFSARRSGAATPQPDVATVRDRSLKLAGYWQSLSGQLLAAERLSAGAPAAVYGSGFYGAYIAGQLARPEQIACFLDRSPFQQGKTRVNKPIVAPEQMPCEVRTLYVGLNPAIAREALADAPWLDRKRVRLVFLDAGADAPA
jgi:SAM-dependent methyltransferase